MGEDNSTLVKDDLGGPVGTAHVEGEEEGTAHAVPAAGKGGSVPEVGPPSGLL